MTTDGQVQFLIIYIGPSLKQLRQLGNLNFVGVGGYLTC